MAQINTQSKLWIEIWEIAINPTFPIKRMIIWPEIRSDDLKKKKSAPFHNQRMFYYICLDSFNNKNGNFLPLIFNLDQLSVGSCNSEAYGLVPKLHCFSCEKEITFSLFEGFES
jgi:hypothetical protein